jgi:putative ABC transport system permease protein
MLKHYLLTVLRHLWKRRLYSFISLFSLTVGLTVFCLLVLNVKHELSYNTGWKDPERIYRMVHKQGGTGANLPYTPGFSSQFLLNIRDYVGDYAESYAEIASMGTSIKDSDQPGFQLTLANQAFLGVFDLPVVAGRLENVVDGSGFIALEATLAETLFGNADEAIGKSLTLNGQAVFGAQGNFVPAQATDFEVAAVFALPEPVTRATQFRAVVADNDYSANLLPAFDGVRNRNLTVWFRLKDGVDPEIVNEALDLYLDEYLITTRGPTELRGGSYSDLFDFRLQPLSEIYFDKQVGEFPQGDRTRLLTFGVVALLVLMAGCSNVISLGLAAAMERRREVGIRKAVGALQQSIMGQSLGEAVVLALLALVPTILLVKLLAPAFAGLLSVANMPDPGAVEIALITTICLCVGLINGIYPAFVLARVKPVAVLKAQAVQQGMRRRFNLRGLLVTAQFGFSITLLVITSALYAQLWITRNQPLGLDARNLALTSINFQLLQTREDLAEVLANGIAAIPGVTAVSPIIQTPLLNNSTATMQIVNTQQDAEGVPVKNMPFKPGLFDLLGVPRLAGRDFNLASDARQPPPEGSTEQPMLRVIINRSAVRALGLSDPEAAIGQRYYVLQDTGARRSYSPIEVIGVVEDSMVFTLRERTGAEFYYTDSFPGGAVLFRYVEAAEADLLARVSAVTMEVTGAPAQTTFLEDRIAQTFTEEQRESRLLLMCAGLALFLSCVGLYGLVSVALKTQIKEIGVRKVLGASTINVVKNFLTRFSVPVLVANLIAWPVAVYAVFEWIQRFPYQLEKGWLLPICLGVTALVLFIAWVTVGALTFRAASAPPVKSLRYE